MLIGLGGGVCARLRDADPRKPALLRRLVHFLLLILLCWLPHLSALAEPLAIEPRCGDVARPCWRGRGGARMVERYDTSISELELRYANNKLIGEEGNQGPDDPNYRRILAGQVPGSDFYLVGGVTEVNYNIRSSGFDVAGGEVAERGGSGIIQGKIFVMNVAIDLRLVQTTSMEVVDVISYQKQIVGREVSAGVFDFLNGNVFDISAGTGGFEPVQLAVRSLIERGTLEIMANLYGAPGPEVCLDASNDPLGAVGPTGGYYPAYANTDTNNGQTRAEPNRWHDRRDGDVRRSRY